MNELEPIDQSRRISRHLAVDAPLSHVGANSHRRRSARYGANPPLANVLEMEDRANAYAWAGTIMCLFVIIIILIMMASSAFAGKGPLPDTIAVRLTNQLMACINERPMDAPHGQGFALFRWCYFKVIRDQGISPSFK